MPLAGRVYIDAAIIIHSVERNPITRSYFAALIHFDRSIVRTCGTVTFPPIAFV
jgi:hypothetical protein